MDNVLYIRTGDLFWILDNIPDSVTGDAVTIEIRKLSDSYTWNFSTLAFASGTNTGSMTFVNDTDWKVSFTPDEDDTYLVTINHAALGIKHKLTLISVNAPAATSLAGDSTYVTYTDIRQELPRITANAMGNPSVTEKIARAEAIINAVCATRYTLPFASTPPLIKTLALHMSCYYVLRAHYSGDAKNISEYVKEYKEAREILEQIRTGKLAVVDSAGVEYARNEEPCQSSTQDYHTVFSMDDIENHVVDSDLEDAIADERD